MRKTLFFSVIFSAFALVLTGCPQPQGEAPKPEPVNTEAKPADVKDVPGKEAAKPQAAAKPIVQPASEEGKALAASLEKLNGKFDLTPDGQFKSIQLDSSAIDADLLRNIGDQTSLETLKIMNFRELNDAMVASLKGLKNLKSLMLTNSGITDAAVTTIVSSFPGLRELDLSSNTLLKDPSLKEISKLKELERLTLVLCNFSEFGMLDIATLPKLKALDIRGNMTVGNSGLDFLSKIATLTALKHRSPAVDDFGLESLTNAKGLDSLEIQDFIITDRAGELLKRFENMTFLSIFRCQGFGSSGLLELKGMKLTRLVLRDLPSVDDSGMEVFRELPTLKRLALNELASVSDAGLLNLVYLKDLATLDIWAVPVTDKGMESIAKLSNLKEMSISSTEITDASIPLILSMPKLEKLLLKDNPGITDAGRKTLKDSGKIKNLDFGTAKTAAQE